MRNSAAIEKYCSYFLRQLRDVAEVGSQLYRKILLVVIIDTLGRARHPSAKGNKQRFLQAIRPLWPESERVSLPQLSYLLGQNRNLRDAALSLDVERRLGTWQDGRIYELDDEPSLSELDRFATRADERGLIRSCRHAELFYTYRNHLVHEFREPGYPMEVIPEKTVPYYMGMVHEQGDETWELVYPIRFFEKLVEHVLADLRHHLEANDLDPYTLYQFGTMWRS